MQPEKKLNPFTPVSFQDLEDRPAQSKPKQPAPPPVMIPGQRYGGFGSSYLSKPAAIPAPAEEKRLGERSSLPTRGEDGRATASPALWQKPAFASSDAARPASTGFAPPMWRERPQASPAAAPLAGGAAREIPADETRSAFLPNEWEEEKTAEPQPQKSSGSFRVPTSLAGFAPEPAAPSHEDEYTPNEAPASALRPAARISAPPRDEKPAGFAMPDFAPYGESVQGEDKPANTGADRADAPLTPDVLMRRWEADRPEDAAVSDEMRREMQDDGQDAPAGFAVPDFAPYGEDKPANTGADRADAPLTPDVLMRRWEADRPEDAAVSDEMRREMQDDGQDAPAGFAMLDFAPYGESVRGEDKPANTDADRADAPLTPDVLMRRWEADRPEDAAVSDEMRREMQDDAPNASAGFAMPDFAPYGEGVRDEKPANADDSLHGFASADAGHAFPVDTGANRTDAPLTPDVLMRRWEADRPEDAAVSDEMRREMQDDGQDAPAGFAMPDFASYGESARGEDKPANTGADRADAPLTPDVLMRRWEADRPEDAAVSDEMRREMQDDGQDAPAGFAMPDFAPYGESVRGEDTNARYESAFDTGNTVLPDSWADDGVYNFGDEPAAAEESSGEDDEQFLAPLQEAEETKPTEYASYAHPLRGFGAPVFMDDEDAEEASAEEPSSGDAEKTAVEAPRRRSRMQRRHESEEEEQSSEELISASPHAYEKREKKEEKHKPDSFPAYLPAFEQDTLPEIQEDMSYYWQGGYGQPQSPDRFGSAGRSSATSGYSAPVNPPPSAGGNDAGFDPYAVPQYNPADEGAFTDLYGQPVNPPPSAGGNDAGFDPYAVPQYDPADEGAYTDLYGQPVNPPPSAGGNDAGFDPYAAPPYNPADEGAFTDLYGQPVNPPPSADSNDAGFDPYAVSQYNPADEGAFTDLYGQPVNPPPSAAGGNDAGFDPYAVPQYNPADEGAFTDLYGQPVNPPPSAGGNDAGFDPYAVPQYNPADEGAFTDLYGQPVNPPPSAGGNDAGFNPFAIPQYGPADDGEYADFYGQPAQPPQPVSGDSGSFTSPMRRAEMYREYDRMAVQAQAPLDSPDGQTQPQPAFDPRSQGQSPAPGKKPRRKMSRSELFSTIATIGVGLFLAILVTVVVIEFGKIFNTRDQSQAVWQQYSQSHDSSSGTQHVMVALPDSGQTLPPAFTQQPASPPDTPTPSPSGDNEGPYPDDMLPEPESASSDTRTKVQQYPNNIFSYISYYASDHAINPALMGKLSIPGVLDEFVVQLQKDDPSGKYHSVDYRGATTRKGAVYLSGAQDLRTPPENIILRGVDVEGSGVFYPLWQYAEDETFVTREAHSFARLTTLYEEAYYVLIAIVVADVDSTKADYFNYAGSASFESDKAMAKFVTDAHKYSSTKVGVEVKASDRLMTLATVSTDRNGKCLVLLYRMVRDDEAHLVPVQAFPTPSPTPEPETTPEPEE